MSAGVYTDLLALRRGGKAIVLVTYRGDWCPYCCAQLVRLGADADRLHASGAEVIAISVDSEQRQLAMFKRWPLPYTLFVSDPGGVRYLDPLGLYDARERGGLGLPALLVIDPDGKEAYRYVGRDFADRTTDAEMFVALEALRLGPIPAPTGGPLGEITDASPGAFPPEAFTPYFNGNYFAATAIGGRLAPGDPGRRVAREHRLMVDASLAAWDRLRPDG